MASYGTSVPSSVSSPSSRISDQIAQLAAALGVQVFNWAQSTYAQTSAITDQSINNFLSTSQIGLQAAQQMLSQYENVTVPEINQLASMAAEYNSPGRISQNMGAAESDAAQTADAARLNSIKALESYGVDPSSGMYAALERTANTQAGAAEAGAGQQAALNTANTGRQLLEQSILQGQQLPGDTVNALNSAYQGISGAENAALSRASVGAQVQGAAAPYFSAAMNLRNPPTGAVSRTGNNSPSSVRDPNANKKQQPPNTNQFPPIPSNSGQVGMAYMGTPKGAKMIHMDQPASEGGPTVNQVQDPAFDNALPPTDPGQFDATGAGFTDPSGVGGPLANDPFNQSWQAQGAPNNGQNPITQTTGTPFTDQSFTNGSFEDGSNGSQTFMGTNAPAWENSFQDPNAQSPVGQFNDQAGAQQVSDTNAPNPNADRNAIWGQLSPSGVDFNNNATFSPGGAEFGGQSYWGPGFNASSGPGYDPNSFGSPAGGFGSFGDSSFNGNWDSSYNGPDATDSWINNANNNGGNFNDFNSSGYSDPWNSQFNFGNDPNNFSFNQNNSNYDPYSAGWQPQDYSPQSWGGGQDWGSYGGGNSGGGSEYARGGRVGARPQARPQQRGVLPTPGGRVPMRASPSQGRQQDDVKANLTSGEFVIPRDVVQMKGHEFFHKLITQSRKNRIMQGQGGQRSPGPSAPVGGQPARPLPGPSRFNSRPQQMGR